jgi:hypothetical protein
MVRLGKLRPFDILPLSMQFLIEIQIAPAIRIIVYAPGFNTFETRSLAGLFGKNFAH